MVLKFLRSLSPLTLLGSGVFIGFSYVCDNYFRAYKLDKNIKRTINSSYELKVTVLNKDNEIDKSYGTGFLVRPNLMVTNYHVIQPLDDITNTDKHLRIRNKDMYDFIGKVVHIDKERDLALITMDQPQRQYITPKNKLVGNFLGTPVFSLCLSNSNDKIDLVFGTLGVEYRCDEPNRNLEKSVYVRMINANIHITNGFSGSPLMDYDGNLIGVNSRSVEPADLLSGALTTKELLVCLDNYDRLNGKLKR